MAAKARELTARASTQGIQSSYGLRQVHPDGSATALWSTTDTSKAEEEALILEARKITLGLVSLGVLFACGATAYNMQAMSNRATRMAADEEEKVRLQAD